MFGRGDDEVRREDLPGRLTPEPEAVDIRVLNEKEYVEKDLSGRWHVMQIPKDLFPPLGPEDAKTLTSAELRRRLEDRKKLLGLRDKMEHRKGPDKGGAAPKDSADKKEDGPAAH